MTEMDISWWLVKLRNAQRCFLLDKATKFVRFSAHNSKTSHLHGYSKGDIVETRVEGAIGSRWELAAGAV